MPYLYSYRRNFMSALLLSLFCFFVPGTVHGDESVSKNRKSPPNFIIIFTDDLGYGDLGVFGATDIATPHIDRMAR